MYTHVLPAQIMPRVIACQARLALSCIDVLRYFIPLHILRDSEGSCVLSNVILLYMTIARIMHIHALSSCMLL